MAIQTVGLTPAVDVIRKRIQQVRERKETIGEENTKATLIDPLLTALGWDLQEIDEVRREYRRKPQDNPVDYALFLNRTECLFLEAKSLEKELADRKWVSQNLSYATVVGVRWCVLSNGDEYRIYNAHAAVDVDEKLFRTVSIGKSDARYLIDTLALLSKEKMRGSLLDELWKAEFIDRHVRQGIEALLTEEDPALVRLICKRTPGVTPSDVRASIKRVKLRVDLPVPDLQPRSAGRLPAPSTGSRSLAAKNAWEATAVLGEANLEALVNAGLVRIPFRIEREYKGVQLSAEIRDGACVVFDDVSYESLSTAAGMARKKVIGSPPDRPYPQTNGWTFWMFRDDTGQLHEIDELRKRFLAGKAAAVGSQH